MTASQCTRPALLGLAALSLLALAAHPAAADTSVYVAGLGGEFGTLDLTGGTNFGAFTAIGTGLSENPVGLGYGSDGSLYGVEGHGFSPVLGPAGTAVYKINPATGAITSTQNLAGAQSYTATAAGGTFYNLTSASSASLFTVDPTVPNRNTVNAGTGINADGLLGAANGTLYAAVIDPSLSTGDDALYGINPSTGNAAFIGDTGTASTFNFYSGVYAGGALYGFGTDNNIYRFNTTSGVATLLGSYSLGSGNTDAIGAATAMPTAVAAVPEPSPFALLTLGLLPLGLAARRRLSR